MYGTQNESINCHLEVKQFNLRIIGKGKMRQVMQEVKSR